MRIILITGGVISGLGKGVIASSIGKMMKIAKIKVTVVKMDPYLNGDAGTMSPYEHGEVYVLKDGTEADLDLGTYERMIEEELTVENSITMGKIYKNVIDKERKGEYLGKTVQVIPHITDEIQNNIKKVAEKYDVCVIELGGTVGDIESMAFIEGLRQLKLNMKNNFYHVHVGYVPFIGEHKTKPIQQSVRKIRKNGLDPDMIICRSNEIFSDDIKNKIALFCNTHVENILICPDIKNLYSVTKILMEQNLYLHISAKLNLINSIDSSLYDDYLSCTHKYENILFDPVNIKIAIIGKYDKSVDSYLSIIKSLEHCSIYTNRRIDYSILDPCSFDDKNNISFSDYNGIIIPGGFGSRGIQGKINCIEYARKNNVPILGICLGFQLMVIEFCRNVINIADASSDEFFSSSPDSPNTSSTSNIITLMDDSSLSNMGGTMVLGEHKISLEENSILHSYYSSSNISERYRHRYHVNNSYLPLIQQHGLLFSGYSDLRPVILELPSHVYYIGTQFHPEFTSRLSKPSPIFLSFVQSCLHSSL